MPPAASGPVFTVSRPIFTGAACAIDGIGNALAPDRVTAPATNLRRLIRRFMASSQGVFRLLNSLSVSARFPSQSSKMVSTDLHRFVFERCCQSGIPAIDKASDRNRRDDLDDLRFVPMLAQLDEHFVGDGVRHLSRRGCDLQRSSLSL